MLRRTIDASKAFATDMQECARLSKMPKTSVNIGLSAVR